MPEDIVLAVEGIDASRMRQSIETQSAYNLTRLCKYPPYQMFVAVQVPNRSGMDSDVYAIGVTKQKLDAGELTAWVERYKAWFEAAGKWPGEDPMGPP